MWNQRYGEDDYAYGTAPNDFLVEKADRLPQAPVLCLAEGDRITPQPQHPRGRAPW
jgi:hypothetical protein